MFISNGQCDVSDEVDAKKSKEGGRGFPAGTGVARVVVASVAEDVASREGRGVGCGCSHRCLKLS